VIRNEFGNTQRIAGVAEDITERKEVDKKLMTYQNNLRSLASKLTSTEEFQRRQIAADLHGNVSQALALSVNQLRRLAKSAASTDAKTLDEICLTIEETGQNVRDLTFDLASPLLYKLGLKAAISEILDEQLRNRHRIACKFSDDKKDKPLDDNVRVLLFQAVRELLINVVKHAKASKVEIAIQRENDNIQIIISDDGVGFDTQKAETAIQRSGGFGLFNIRERIDYIGGSFEMYSQPGSGSRFVLTAPIKTKTD
jgi:signal transduction histidine kinase